MDTCEIGVQVDLIKYRNSNSTASTSDTSQFKLHHISTSGESSRKEKCKSTNVKKLSSNIESELECPLGAIDTSKNLHHMVDLGELV